MELIPICKTPSQGAQVCSHAAENSPARVENPTQSSTLTGLQCSTGQSVAVSPSSQMEIVDRGSGADGPDGEGMAVSGVWGRTRGSERVSRG